MGGIARFVVHNGKLTRPSSLRAHKSWHAMWHRCIKPGAVGYADYGGRGITVCDRWKSFENFFADMGERPEGTTLDRIDVNGNYEPKNCRWATDLQQNNNRTNSRVLTLDGKSMSVSEWSRELGVPRIRLANRVRRGWPVEQILNPNTFKRGRRASI